MTEIKIKVEIASPEQIDSLKELTKLFTPYTNNTI